MADSTKDAEKQSDCVEAAVIRVISSIGLLYKANDNKFDKYKYASIDDFILFVREHCADAGLVIIQDEIEAKLVDVTKKDGKGMAMWWAKFAFTVQHIGGSKIGPVNRSVMVQANGAQASGSAQSYALKQFLRGQFLIPTGDGDDPDKVSVDISTRGDKETDLQRVAGKIRRAMLTAQDMEELDAVWADNSVNIDQIKRTSETAHDFLRKEYQRKADEFRLAGNVGAG